MRILLANKFYYDRGGDCKFTMNLEQLLKSKQHQVAIYAMDYPQNEKSEWNIYWPSNMSYIDILTRPLGSSKVIKSFKRLIKDFKPDVVHLNNIHTQLSPIIAKIAHENGIRVVWTLHDTKIVCPCYTCMHNGKWCTACFTNKMAVIKHRCMKGSLIGSIIGFLEAKKWNSKRLQAYTNLFLPPSQFMADTCIAGGYDKSKFKVLCNFIDVNKVKNPCLEKENYYVFLGRLTEVKGIRTLCKAAADLPYKLIIIGGGELEEELRNTYKNCSQIEFIGQKKWEEFRPILEKARFMVIPSEWSENNPLTVIEAQSLGVPVLGARIGGIPELIEEGISGMTFESGNISDLKIKISKMFEVEFDYQSLAKQSVKRYSAETYYQQLMEYYKG